MKKQSRFSRKKCLALFKMHTWFRIVKRIPLRIKCRVENKSFVYYSPSNDDLRMRAIFNFEGWESNERDFFANVARVSDSIVDVGAYTGIYSLTAIAVNPAAEIVAFEPNPRLMQCIEKNFSLNRYRNGFVKSEALSDSEHLSRPLFGANGRGNSTFSLDQKMHGEHSLVMAYVKSNSLDNLLVKAPELIKIDVEGHELSVLHGAAKCLAKSSPVLLIEILSEQSRAEIVEFLTQFQYQNSVLIGPKKKNYVFIPRKLTASSVAAKSWLLNRGFS